MAMPDMGTLLRRTLGRTVRRCVTLQTLLLYSWDLQDMAESGSDVAAQCQISEVPGPDSSLFAALCARFPGRDFASRWHQGQQCFVASINGLIAGFGWVAHGRLWIDEIELLYELGPGEVFIYDCYVDAFHRGVGIYPALIDAAARNARRAGSAPAVALIASMAWNKASIRGIGKTNFKKCRRIRYLKLIGLRKWWWLPALPAKLYVAP